MSKNSLVLFCVVIAGALGVALVALARDDDRRRFRSETNEVLFGDSWCSAEPDRVWNSLYLNATGDVVEKQSWGSQIAGESSTPAEDCDVLVAKFIEILGGRGCAIGFVDVYDDEEGGTAARSFQFSCEARRSEIVRTIGELSAAMLARPE